MTATRLNAPARPMLTTASLALAALAAAAAVALAIHAGGPPPGRDQPAGRPAFSRRMTTLPTVVVTTPRGTPAAAGTAAPVR